MATEPGIGHLVTLCQNMEYVDPHHKRTDFSAESFSASTENARGRIAFAGHGQHTSVVLREQGSSIVAVVPDVDHEFVLRKVQILEKSKWLTLDFRENPMLRRILIHIDRLDIEELAAAITSLIGSRSLLYYRHHV